MMCTKFSAGHLFHFVKVSGRLGEPEVVGQDTAVPPHQWRVPPILLPAKAPRAVRSGPISPWPPSPSWTPDSRRHRVTFGDGHGVFFIIGCAPIISNEKRLGASLGGQKRDSPVSDNRRTRLSCLMDPTAIASAIANQAA